MIKEDKHFKIVFDYIVNRTKNYVIDNRIESLVLGISGGIDSTLVAVIAQRVAHLAKIPLIGRSIRIKNGQGEFDTSRMVGESFCTDFDAVNLGSTYSKVSDDFLFLEKSIYGGNESKVYSTPISEGNLMARLRMMYLYNLAGINKGLVLDTDNLTEHNLGFWTLHGDEGDFNPIGGLWKTEVYGLSKWILGRIKGAIYPSDLETTIRVDKEIGALTNSISLIPTDGNGISSSDLEQIGGKDYFEVDKILKPIVEAEEGMNSRLVGYNKYLEIRNSGEFDPCVVDKIYNRFDKSRYKRLTSRTIKITRKELLDEINRVDM